MTRSGSIVEFPNFGFWVRTLSFPVSTDMKQCQKSQRRLFQFLLPTWFKTLSMTDNERQGGERTKLRISPVVNTPKTSTTSSTFSVGKVFAFKEAQFIDWLLASPYREKGDAHIGGTQVRSYSSFLWASRQLIWYLIEMNGWAKFKQQHDSGLTLQLGPGWECQPSVL